LPVFPPEAGPSAWQSLTGNCLDLGSGAGLDFFLAARQVGESGRVIGVDITPEMLERARSNARQINASNVEFREGYLEALPVEPASVDVVISNCVINLAPDKSRVFQEIFRVLKPGGRIAVSDTVANQPIPEDAGKSKEWCSCASGALTKSAYQQELNQAGFTDIQIQPNTQMLKTAIASGKIKTNREVTIEQMLDDLANFEKIDRLMIIPHDITASKPL
jgi:ubiquinone/menaquinone biosynthesis C-methylase UbiE